MASAALVIFDCDGVLVDTELLSAELHAAAFARLGYSITREELLRRFVGVADRDMYAILEREWGCALPRSYDDAHRQAATEAFTRLRPIAGVEEVLAVIAEPVCVASSSTTESLRFKLECAGLWPRFAPHVFSAALVARGKPAPDLFLHAAERLGAAPQDCIVVEDSIAGVTAGVAAGMRVLGFCGAGHCAEGHGERLREAGAATVFAQMEELPRLL